MADTQQETQAVAQQETKAVTLSTPQQAVNLLIQGVQVAQQRGAYQLNEASVLSEAVNFLTGAPDSASDVENTTENTETVDETEETTES